MLISEYIYRSLCECVHVCVCVCTRVHMCVCAGVRMRVRARACVRACVRVCVRARVCVQAGMQYILVYAKQQICEYHYFLDNNHTSNRVYLIRKSGTDGDGV